MQAFNRRPRLHAWLPTPGNVLFTLIAIVVALWANNAGALPFGAPQAPAAASSAIIPYQGKLANASGAPISGQRDMTFKLYSAASGPNAELWSESWSNVQVTDGLFNVLLGSTTPISAIIIANGSLWLGITVGSDAEMTPRVQLGAAPFAMTVPDGSVTTAKLADGAVTSAKLDAVDAYSYVSAQEIITKTVWSDLPTPDIVSFSLDHTQWVYIYYGATATASPDKPAYMGIIIDNGSIIDDAWIEMWGNNTTTISGFYRVQLAAGPHTVKLQYFTQVGSTAYFWRRRLLAFAISQ